MNHLTMITQILAVASTLSFLWLTARAFRKHTGWGLGVLLLSPFSATLFGMKFWDSEKKPFLLYACTTVITVGLALYLFSTWGGWELLRASTLVQQGIETQRLSHSNAEAFIKASQGFAEKSGMKFSDPQTLAHVQQIIDQEQAKQAAIQVTIEQQAEKDNLSASRISKKVETVPDERIRLVYRTIQLKEAHRYIGATVKVTRRNVEEKEYRLTGATNKSLQFAQRNTNGAYSFAFRMNDIEKLRVLIKEPY